MPSSRAAHPSLPLLETLFVEPGRAGDSILAAQAERVQCGALDRLRELHGELALSDLQLREIFPLLARAHPDYSRDLRLVGVRAVNDLDPLGKLAADRRIHKLLDPEQQLDLEILAASADVWWTDVIARLEKDLAESTREPLPLAPTPEPGPLPAEDIPAPSPLAPPPNPRSNNLFDLVQPGRS
jgi:hypothetical protein